MVLDTLVTRCFKELAHMKTSSIALALNAVLLLTHPASAELKVGDAAPDFDLPGSDGKSYGLSSFRGKQAVVVAWFPKAFTGG